ncbi:MAG: hypothetical protein QOE70_5902 [Chthoniobacter sp.]|jgi:hypothetical protein|nr:hypothetical protein [Chthoniobacter sp.]
MNALSSPPDTEPRPAERVSIHAWLAKAQPFTFSALIHAVLVLILGGSVLLKVQEEAPDFTAEGGDLVSNETVTVTPPETKPDLQPTEFSPTNDAAAPSVSAPSAVIAALTTSAQANVSLNASPTLSPTLKMTTDLKKPLTMAPPALKGTLSKDMATRIAGFTAGWAKGGTASMSRPLKSREFQFTAYLAKYQGGDWDSTIWMRDNEIGGGSLANLLYLVGKLSKGKIDAEPQLVPLDLSSDEIFVKKPPFIWFTGHRDFKLTDQEVTNLAEYLRSGGCLWGDSSVPGQRSRFDIAFRREMLRLVPPGEQWLTLPPNHPIYASNYFPEIREAPAGINFYHEPVYGLLGYGGALAILYTANDYGDMWQFGLDENYEFDTTRDQKRRMVAINEEMWNRRNLYFRNIEPKALLETYKFGTNVIVHLLTRWEDKVRNAPRAF